MRARKLTHLVNRKVAINPQAALTLRRWRQLLGAAIHWAGLSATLDNAALFLRISRARALIG